MDVSQSQKSRVDIDLNHDYISNLPAEVKEKILVKLPIKEVVRTSILSSKWVDSWVSIPDLVFEERCTEWELIDLVDAVLINHQGPIQKFKLVSNHACNEAIARWLVILSKNGTKELELLCGDDDVICEIPLHLVSCILLERLSLTGCLIDALAGCLTDVPSYFPGLKLVHTLILSDFALNGITIENIVLSCPLLDHLELSDFFQYGCLRILAPKLTFLMIFGKFHDIFLETPKVTSGCIHLVHPTTNYQESSVARDNKESNIIRALGRLSSIQKLDIRGEFLEYLAIGSIPPKLPAIFDRLTKICLQFNIYPNEITAALCLFENAPNLEILRMEFAPAQDIDRPNGEAAWEPKAVRDCLFKRLRVVNITYAEYHDPELFLQSTNWMLQSAKFVLSTASVLEKLNFIKLENVRVFFEMLNWFPKLSKMAEIKFVSRYAQ